MSDLSISNAPLHFSFSSRFVKFVQSQSVPAIKTELQTLLWPLLCHIYIEMVKGRESRPASDFLRKYAYLIGPIENLHSPVVNKVNGTASVPSGGATENATPSHRQTSSPPLPSSTTQILFSADGKPSMSPNAVDGAKSVASTEVGTTVTNDFFKELVQSLSLCLRIDEIESIEIARRFRNAKYEMVLSLQALYAIKHFLAKNGHVIILHILQTWFSFEIREALFDSDMDEQDADDDSDQTDGPTSNATDKNGITENSHHSDGESSDDAAEYNSRRTSAHSEIRKMLNKIKVEIKTINGLSSGASGGNNRSTHLRDTIVRMADGVENDTDVMAKPTADASASPVNSHNQPNYNVVQNKYLQNVRAAVIRSRKLEQPMRVLNLLNADHKLCAGDIDPLECHLVCAFDDSTIKLWQLNQSRIRGRKPFSPFSNRLCEWCLENCESSSDDDSDDESPTEYRHTNGLFGAGSSSLSNFGGLNSIKPGTNRKKKKEQKRIFMEQRCEDNTLYVIVPSRRTIQRRSYMNILFLFQFGYGRPNTTRTQYGRHGHFILEIQPVDVQCVQRLHDARMESDGLSMRCNLSVDSQAGLNAFVRYSRICLPFQRSQLPHLVCG